MDEAHRVARSKHTHGNPVERPGRDGNRVAAVAHRALGAGRRARCAGGADAIDARRIAGELAQPLDHVAHLVAGGVGAGARRGGPVEIRPRRVAADQVDVALHRRVVGAAREVAVERRAAVGQKPAARGLDALVARRGGALLEREVARDQGAGVDAAHQGEAGKRHRDQHDQGDEQHRAPLRAAREHGGAAHDTLQIMLRSGTTVSKTRYL